MTTYQRLSRIRKADVFDDTLSAASIAGVEGTAVDHEDFLAGMLSQFKRVVGGTDWYSAVQSAAADPRNLKTLTDDVYFKSVLRRRAVLTDVTVPALQNYVVLSVASSEAPTETAAVGAGSASGAVVATLSGGVVGVHELTEVAGLNPVSPKNLLLIRDAANFDPILSSGREVYGLLQTETATADGDAFDDSTKQVQISFVRQTSGGDDLEAVPAADVAGKAINYTYVSREKLHALNEQDFLSGTFQDPQSAAATTLQEAYLAGNTIDVLTAEGNLTFNLSQDLTSFKIERATGVAFATFLRDDTLGDKLTLDLDTLDINNVNDVDFAGGAAFDTSGTTINVGVTAAQIDASGLALYASTGDVTLRGADDVLFQTVRETTPFPLDDATAGPISALPGGPYTSVSGAIRAALLSSDIDVFVQVLANDYAQDANVPGTGNSNAQDWSPALDLSARSIDMNTPSGVNTIIVYNGAILLGGNGVTNNDVYAGTTPANGDLKYDFAKGVKAGDVVLAFSWKAA